MESTNKQVNMHKQPIWMELSCASDQGEHHREVFAEITGRDLTFLAMGI